MFVTFRHFLYFLALSRVKSSKVSVIKHGALAEVSSCSEWRDIGGGVGKLTLSIAKNKWNEEHEQVFIVPQVLCLHGVIC